MRIAIVEDERETQELMISYINRYETENDVKFEVKAFPHGVDFISDYKSDFDIVFLDIQMPYMDGMTVAHKLRELDENVTLIFVTNMAKYAVNGYEVSALDFMVKPVRYVNFKLKMDRAIKDCKSRRRNEIVVPFDGSVKRIPVEDILYIEVSKHTLIYHMTNGKIVTRGAIKNEEERLKEFNFARCSNSFLVNLAKVTNIDKNEVTVNEQILYISRSKKSDFYRALAEYVGGGGRTVK